MPWTYDAAPFSGATIPSKQNNRDSVRFLIGDTDGNDPQLDDGEVDGLLVANTGAGDNNVPNVYLAAIQACASLAARYARKASMSVGDLSIQWNQIGKSYIDLAKALKFQAARRTRTLPYAGGISQSDMDANAEDTDVVQPWASVGMTDNSGGAPDYGASTPLGETFERVVPG